MNLSKFTAFDAAIKGRDVLPTDEAAMLINRAPQTLRKWACLECGPILPIRINGRLAWRVSDLQALLSGGLKKGRGFPVKRERQMLPAKVVGREIQRVYHDPEKGECVIYEVFFSAYAKRLNDNPPSLFVGLCAGKFVVVPVWFEERFQSLDSLSDEVISRRAVFFDVPQEPTLDKQEKEAPNHG